MNFLLHSLIGIMAAEAQQSDRVNLRNVIARALLEHRKRGADDDVLAEAILFDEDEEIEIKRARNTWQRPGGSNATGRTDYANSTWAKMLRDNTEEFMKPESAMAKIFRRRFRVPYPIFVVVLSWTKDWHETAATDVAGRVRVPTELKLLGVL